MGLLRSKIYTLAEAENNPSRVQKLWLHGKSFDHDLCPQHLARFVRLEELQIGWYYDRKLPDEIAELEKLKSLVCLNMPVDDLPEWLFSLRHLRELTVRGSDIQSIPDQIERLAELRDVDFGNNGLAAVPAALGALLNLRTLSLADNRITTLPMEVFRLPRLRWLGLVNNNFNEYEVKTIREQFRRGKVFVYPSKTGAES